MELKRNGIYTYKGNVMNENCKRIILSEEAHKKLWLRLFLMVMTKQVEYL